MAIVKTEGIVIGETSYSESSKILKVFTRKYGIISVMSRGCKKIKSPFHEVSNKLVYANFDLSYKETGISTLVAVDIIKIFKNIVMDYKDIEKKMYAFSLIDLSKQILEQKQTSKNEVSDIYDIFISALYKIDENFNPLIIIDIVKLKCLEYLGVKPSLDSCSNCGSETDIVTFSSKCYGFICKDCYVNEKLVSEDAIKMLRMLYYVDINRIKKLDIDLPIFKEIDDFLDEYYEEHTGIYSSIKDKMKGLSKISSICKSTGN